MSETKTSKATVTTTKNANVLEGKKVRIPVRKKTAEPTLVEKKKILFVASEARPVIATGGLADGIGSLPQALAKDPKYDIRVVLPLYSDVKSEHRRKMSFLGNLYVTEYAAILITPSERYVQIT